MSNKVSPEVQMKLNTYYIHKHGIYQTVFNYAHIFFYLSILCHNNTRSYWNQSSDNTHIKQHQLNYYITRNK